jgi:hypothetical protein
MTSGMGSVVSPIPRLMIFASGYFSKCAAFLLAIYLARRSKTRSVKRKEEINRKQKNQTTLHTSGKR